MVQHCRNVQLVRRYNRERGQYHKGYSECLGRLVSCNSAAMLEGSVSKEIHLGERAIQRRDARRQEC